MPPSALSVSLPPNSYSLETEKGRKKVPACFPMWNTFMLNEHATCKVAFTWVWHNTSPSTSHKNHEPQTVLNIHTNTQEGLSLRLARRGNG